MKKFKTILLAVTILTTVCSACKKSEEVPANSSSTVVVTGSLGFDNLNGFPFKSSNAKVTKSGTTYTLVAVEDGSKRGISIVLNNVTAIGSFTLSKGNTANNTATLSKDNTSSDAVINYKTDGNSASNKVGGGSVDITKLSDTEIEARFFIVGYNSAKSEAFVENGSFTGKLTKN